MRLFDILETILSVSTRCANDRKSVGLSYFREERKEAMSEIVNISSTLNKMNKIVLNKPVSFVIRSL